MDFGALRDKSRNTRLLILAHLHERPTATFSEIANHLDISVQAVSVHAKGLTKEGYLSHQGNHHAVTSKGLQWLHEAVRDLHAAVGRLGQQLDVIHTTSAIATQPIRGGDAVVLYMHEGDLAARPGTDGASRGIAQHDADAESEVVVGELSGMVELQPGSITVVTVPEPAAGGSRRVATDRLTAKLADARFDRIGALGTGAAILARRVGPLHIEFAVPESCFNAAERGLNVLLYASRDRLVEALQTIERHNRQTLRHIPVATWEAPTA